MSLILTLATMAALPLPLLSQSFPYDVPTRSRRGFMPDSMTGAVDSIDPVTGALHLNIPIASMPDGPGPDFTLSLVYNSANFNVRPWYDDWPELYFFQKLQAAGGWSFNFENLEVDIEGHILGEVSEYMEEYCETAEYKPRFARLWARLPDGGSHLLHLYGDGDQVGDVSEDTPSFYHYTIDGDPYCEEPDTPSEDSLDPEAMTWFSTDGSFLKYEIGPSTPDGVLYMKDGSQVEFEDTWGQPTIIRDANGNELHIENYCYDPYP
jgi:hypothetical protein